MTDVTLENLRLALHQLADADAFIDATRELSIHAPETAPLQEIESTHRELPDVLTVREAANVLRVGTHTIYEAIQRNQLPSVRMGRRILIPKIQILKLLGGDARRS